MTTEGPIKPLRPKLSTAPDLPPDPPAKPARAPAPEKRPLTLTFSDGLNFGCGFWIAGGVLFGAIGFGLLILGVLSRL